MRFRSDIEGLRAVAVVAVVLFHCRVPGFSGGYIGVDVFFVLSGFLITSLMLREIDTTSRLSLAGFYGRRARRLIPAATMVILVTVLLGWRVLSPLARRSLVGDAISTTTYSINWRLAAQSTDYFQSALAPSALQHFWSLAVEEQFYILWPIVVWGLAGPRLHRARLVGVVSLVVLASFALSLVVTTRSQPWAFFGLHTRMWQLGAGSLLAAVWPSVDRINRSVRLAAPMVGLAAVLGAITIFDESTAWPGAAALLPTLGTLAVLIGSDAGPIARMLAWWPAVWIGARSYSWYLWHWPALVLFAAWRGSVPSVPVSLAVALGALLVGHLGFTFVEQPIRQRRSLVTSPRRSIGVGLSLSVLGLAALIALRIPAQHVDATGPVASEIAVPDDEQLPALLEAAADVDDVPSNLMPSLSDARDDLPAVYALGCHADIATVEPKLCELGDPEGSTTVALVGDSHAAQWVPALADLAAESDIRLVAMTKSGCPVFDVVLFSTVLNREYTECAEWRDRMFASIAAIGPDVVITTQSSLYTPADTNPDDVDATILAAYVESLNALAPSTSSLVVLGDTPFPMGDVPDCLSGHPADATACASGREQALRNHRSDVEAAAAERTGARYVPVDDLVCGPTRCPVVVGDLLVYRDDSHLSTPYVRWLAPALADRLGAPWPPRG